MRILHNRFQSLLRRKHPSHEVSAEPLEHLLTTRPERESRLETAAFKRAFAQLSPTHREILVMVGVHGMTDDDIARVWGCQVGTVKSRMSRARALLKETLLGEGRPTRTVAKPLPDPARGTRRPRPASPAKAAACARARRPAAAVGAASATLGREPGRERSRPTPLLTSSSASCGSRVRSRCTTASRSG